jgi:hypothetical protein
MLGLGFEHRSPDAPDILIDAKTPHNQNKLVNYFGMPILQIIDEILLFYTQAQTKYTAYDPTSIMVLPMGRTIVRRPSDATLGNFDLSTTDKCFIAALYPKTFQIEWLCSAVAGTQGFLSIDADDNVYFFRSNAGLRLTKLTPGGVISELFTVPSECFHYDTRVAIDNSDRIYLSNGRDMFQFDPPYTSSTQVTREQPSGALAYFNVPCMLDNNELVYTAGLLIPGTTGFNAIESFRYNSGTDVTSSIASFPLSLSPFSYLEATVSNNNLVYMQYGTGNSMIKLDTDAGSFTWLTPAIEANDISNLSLDIDGAPFIKGLSASRDIDEVTFLRMGFYEISPGCGQHRYFLFAYNPNCDSSCEVRNFGMLPISMNIDGVIGNNLEYSKVVTTRDGETTYILGPGLLKITNHR